MYYEKRVVPKFSLISTDFYNVDNVSYSLFMSQPSSISVVITNYNYGRFVSQAIQGVLAQTVPIREIIVVDDGSTDNSREVVARFGEQVKFIDQENQGVGAARNTGAKNSSGEFIAFLDADDIWLPNKMEEQLKVFAADENIGLVSCGMREFDTRTGETIKMYLPDKSEWSAYNILLRQHSILGGGSANVARRAIFEKAGGFDQNREMHPAEDWEFCYRMALAGKVVCVLKILVDYRNHGGNGHLKTARMERAMLLSYEKIFAAAPPEFAALKQKCYGDLHTVLAGSYFQAGDYLPFLKHSVKGIRMNPLKIAHYLAYPVRAAKRLIGSKTKASKPLQT